ncbi:MAG: DUF5652 family protein [Candidatus Peregrinibacteria bacterium]|nr:DUF5652 family protein [Candidatus Peregrinibacteria bacterium]
MATETKEGVAPEGNILDPANLDFDLGPLNPVVETLNQWVTEPWFNVVIIVLLIWTLIWDGIALWHAARNDQKKWFIAILLLNTAGILEILYLKFWQRKAKKQ